MKRLAPVTIIIAGLSACSQPEPIQDYNAPYTGKYSAPVASVRPEPRPVTQRMWYACPDAQFNEDCGNGETPAPAVEQERERQTPVPEAPQAPSVPANPAPPETPSAPEIERPTDNGEPEQPVEPEPEVHEPEPEIHEPPPPPPETEWCPND
jgi:hypothetical protein